MEIMEAFYFRTFLPYEVTEQIIDIENVVSRLFDRQCEDEVSPTPATTTTTHPSSAKGKLPLSDCHLLVEKNVPILHSFYQSVYRDKPPAAAGMAEQEATAAVDGVAKESCAKVVWFGGESITTKLQGALSEACSRMHTCWRHFTSPVVDGNSFDKPYERLQNLERFGLW